MTGGTIRNNEPLLHTKLFAPSRHGIWIARARLLKRLDDGIALGHKLLLISAPPGFGKTTLVTAWLNPELPPPPSAAHDRDFETRPRAAWYALDEGDNDTARFMAYLYSALETMSHNRADWQELRALLKVSPLPALDTLLVAAINLLQAENIGVPRVLVLEDYHVIQNPEIHRALAFWLDHTPPNFHIVITSRADPPLPLARMRARMQLTEIRAAELRFTTQEAATFLNTTMGVQLSATQLETLEQKTEGWVAGLQLAALSLQKDANADDMLRAFTGTHRYIMDYLVEEVLQREPESVQTFLLYASLLDRFNASVCEAVIPSANGAGAQLDYLERRNLFIVPLDDRREWYRFHHLFAQVLRQRMRRLHPAEISNLQVRAGEWFQARHLYSEAIQYALAAQAFDRAAEWIQTCSDELLRLGEHQTLQRWLDALPESILDAHPALWLVRAEILVIAHQLDAAEQALAHMQHALPQIRDAAYAAGLSANSAALGVKIALNRNDVARTLSLGQQALATLDAQKLLTRASVLLHMGVAYDWNGQLDRAVECFSESRRLGEQANDTASTLLAIANLGAAEKTRAEYRRAAEIYREGVQLDALHRASYLPPSIYLFTDLAELAYEWNDLDGERPFIDQALERSERLGWTRGRIVSYRILAQWLGVTGQTQQAHETITRALQLAQEHKLPYHYASPAQAVRIMLWLNTGNLANAVEWAETAAPDITRPFDKPRQEEYVALAHVHLAQNKPQLAQATMELLIADAQTHKRTESVIWGCALLALAYQAQDQLADAITTLQRALTLAAPQGFVRTFLDLGEPMQTLLNACRRAPEFDGNAVLQTYIGSLLSNSAPPPPAPKSVSAPQPVTAYETVEALTERERQVLELVAQGMSDKQIAAQLVVATGTVKRHLNNIYSKLGVNSRTQALARARQVGWID